MNEGEALHLKPTHEVEDSAYIYARVHPQTSQNQQ